jgi:hypothetical protein
MIDSLFNLMFSCAHKRTSFPLTPTRGDSISRVAARTGTYVVCLDCGKEFAYNWRELRIEPTVRQRPVRERPVKVRKTATWLLHPLLRLLS